MVTIRLLSLLHAAALLSLMPGCWSVSIGRIGLTDERNIASTRSEDPTVLECLYTLDEGEVLQEVVWSKEGTILQTISDPPDLVSEYPLPSLSREDAGDYQCSVTTTDGSNDKKYYELIVEDRGPGTYLISFHQDDCLFNVTFETPQSYPEMTAFCGMWVDETDQDGNLGHWMEEPPMRKVLNSNPKVSFSTERGDFTEIRYGNRFTKVDLINGIIKVKDTVVNSVLKCITGFYKKSGEFIEQASIISKNFESFVKNKCPASTLAPYAAGGVSVQYSDYYRITCRNMVAPQLQKGDLQATLRCRATGATVVLGCHGNDWMFKNNNGSLEKNIDSELNSFEEECIKVQGSRAIVNSGDGDRNGSASYSPSCTAIVASSFLLFVLATRR